MLLLLLFVVGVLEAMTFPEFILAPLEAFSLRMEPVPTAADTLLGTFPPGRLVCGAVACPVAAESLAACKPARGWFAGT